MSDPRLISRHVELLAERHNLTAVAGPTATDDESNYYSKGSVWINQTTDDVYICADATTGSAVWQLVAPGSKKHYNIIYGPYEYDHADASPFELFNIPANCVVNAYAKSTEDDAGGVDWEIGIEADTDAFLANADMPSATGNVETGPKGAAGLFFSAEDTAILTITAAGTGGAGLVWFSVTPLETS